MRPLVGIVLFVAVHTLIALVVWADSRRLGRAVVGTGEEPDGLCGDRTDHSPHLHESATLGRFWCTADQSRREPHRSQVRVGRTVSFLPPSTPPEQRPNPQPLLEG